jgi:hypothetical protein
MWQYQDRVREVVDGPNSDTRGAKIICAMDDEGADMVSVQSTSI